MAPAASALTVASGPENCRSRKPLGMLQPSARQILVMNANMFLAKSVLSNSFREFGAGLMSSSSFRPVAYLYRSAETVYCPEAVRQLVWLKAHHEIRIDFIDRHENHPDIMILQLLVDPFTNLLKISMRGITTGGLWA